MNRIKDFLYNKNDIVIAFIIVAVTVFIILWRVDVILAYPQELVAMTYVEEDIPAGPITTPYDDNAGAADGNAATGGGIVGSDAEDGEGSGEGEGSEGGTASGVETPEMFAIYINYGETSLQIAQKMVDVGFFESTDEFLDMVNELDAETKLKTGNHIIPENATKEEVIEYLMEPGL